MAINIDNLNIKSFILVGDKVLIKPQTEKNRTKSGLFLPPGIQEKEEIYTGWILKVGPGMPIPQFNDVDEPWKETKEQIKYLPLQAKEGDLALYLQKSAYELTFNNEKYVIIPHAAILLLIRDDLMHE